MILQIAVSVISIINTFLILIGSYKLINLSLTKFPRPIKICVSILIALSMISYLYYLILILNSNFIVLLIVLTIINAIHIYWSFDIIKKVFNYQYNSLYNLNTLVICAAVLLSAVFFLFHGSKYGDFDAWALWNTRAKDLYDIQYWKRMFLDNLVMSHSDYPLMLASLVAFLWKIINSTSFVVPLIFSFFLIVVIPLFVYHSLNYKSENKALAWIGLLVIVADTKFQILASAQCADTLLSIFILATFVLYNDFKFSSGKVIYIIGFICASCMWIKNEGILFFLVFSIIFCIKSFKSLNQLLKYIIGAILPILVVVSFKLLYAPTNDLVSANNSSKSTLIHNVTDISRYIYILNFSMKLLVDNFWSVLVMLLFAIIFYWKSLFTSSFLIVLLLLGGYFFVYLNTPYDLQWHLYTSLYRLLYHIYPSLIYLLLASVGDMKFKYFENLKISRA